MSQLTRRAITLSSLVIGFVVAFGIYDLHRVLLRAVFPFIQDFWFTFIAF